MTFLIFLIFALAIGIIFFVYRALNIIANNQLQEIVLFFKRYLMVVFIGLFVIYLIFIIIHIVNIDQSEYVYVYLIKFIIQFAYFYTIFNYTNKLLNNLSSETIFDKQNASLTKQIGLSFFYLAITEIIAGLIIGFIALFVTGEFGIGTNSIIVMFLAIGLILIIISFILEKAIEIYQENKLTI